MEILYELGKEVLFTIVFWFGILGRVTAVGLVTVIFALSVAYIPIVSSPIWLKDNPFSKVTLELVPLA